MSQRIYCIGCKTSEPFLWRGHALEAGLRPEDLPRGWVLRTVTDRVMAESRERGLGRSPVTCVTTWVLCYRCALEVTPVIHPEVRKVLVESGHGSG